MVKEINGNELSAKRVRDLADNLSGAFGWRSTGQGFDYWDNVCDSLLSVATEIEKQEHCPTCGRGN